MSLSANENDAASMLEKALNEMDDIFKDDDNVVESNKSEIYNNPPYNQEIYKNFSFGLSKSNDNYQQQDSTKVLNLKKCFDDLEFLLSGYILDSVGLSNLEKEAIHNYIKNLNCANRFLEESKQHPINGHGNNGLEQQLRATEADLQKTKKSLADYARKNEELLIRLTERRVADKKPTNQNVNHDKLLVLEEDREMERLKSHIETLLDEQEKRKSTGSTDSEDNLASLKNRLREKASECNRLKVELEDMRQLQQTKDNTIIKIQEQIQHLFKENELLRQQVTNSGNFSSNRVNGGGLQTPDPPRSESVCSNRSQRNSQKQTKEIFNQIQGLKSASEPNLMRNLSVGIVSTPTMSLMGDDRTRYRSFKRMISDAPFASWSSEQIQDWMRDEGLEEYTAHCSKNVKKGDDLLKFTMTDYERHLGITDPIHKRKLNYALKAVTSNGPDYAGRLDHNWVVRWLEDLGLPQYKQAFFTHKVDGRILLHLTLDDLLQLRVYSLLHHASLKRAIQFLRHQKFHPQYFREIANQSDERCDHVMLWTNQRIMHWLRSVDLAEYAPNLRGRGVHGALMVLEPRFNADTLADLLSIPLNKTLLRRHLGSHFMTLLGDACQRQKEMTQKTTDFVPLNDSEKHKLRKKGLGFGSLRRKKSETNLDAMVCPLELDVSNLYSPPPALDPDMIFDLSENTSLSPSFNDNASNSTNDTNVAPVRLAEISSEIDQMTTNLGSDHPDR